MAFVVTTSSQGRSEPSTKCTRPRLRHASRKTTATTSSASHAGRYAATGWIDIVVGVGIALLNADAARAVWKAARQEGLDARA